MARGSRVGAIGPPSECSKNLAAALEELRRRQDIEWVIEKLEAAGFMESGETAANAGAAGQKKTLAGGAPVKAKRQLLTRSEDGGLPVEGLKWVIRELKLNTGQSFWKNNVTREDFLKVLLSHFKARQPIRSKNATATETRGASALATASKKRGAGTTSNLERIRHGLISARTRHEIASEVNMAGEPPSYVGLLADFQKGAAKKQRKPQSPFGGRPLVQKGWRDFAEDTSEGILYQTRVGLSRNWHTVKEVMLRRVRPAVAGLPESTSTMMACFKSSSNGDDTLGGEVEPLDPDTAKQEEESKLMRRKGAQSIYELSTRADKGPLLMRNGVLEALSVLSLVDDPRTSRYVGAAYVNMAALGRDVCVDMLKHQVGRCLFRMWRRALTLVDNSVAGNDSNDEGSTMTVPSAFAAMETEEEWCMRRCGLDVLDQVAVALCHLTVPMGSESVMMHERGMDAIMWYARDGHGHERLQVVGLQCLVNFHRNAPNGTFHESILPCLKHLGRSATAGIRRFTGQAICSLGANKAGASQLLAGGVLEILANLSKSQQSTCSQGNGSNSHDSVDGSRRGGTGGRQGGHPATVDTLLVEACAQAAANLTSANAEFVRQALTAPETVAEVLEVLYLGGGGGGGSGADNRIGGGTRERGSKRAASCRQNSARVLRSICCGADASEVARLVQLGFLLKLEQFFGQAESQNDEKAQELLAHSMWYMSVTLTDTKPPTPPPTPPTPAPSAVRGDDGSVPSKGGQQQQQQARRGRRRSSSTSVSVGGQVDATAARGTVGARGRRRSSIASNCVSVSAASEAKSARSHRGTTVIRASVVGGRGLIAPPNEDTLSDASSHSLGQGLEGGGPKTPATGLPLDSKLPEDLPSSSTPEVVVDKGPHVVACGVMRHILRLTESGTTAFVRECCTGVLCNLARKTWMTADICKEIGMPQMFLKSMGVALAQGEEGTSKLAADGLWNLISRMSQDRPFIQECLSLGVVGGLCGAAKGAAELLVALAEATGDDAGERPGTLASFAETGMSEALEEVDYANEAAGDEFFRKRMRATVKACLQSLHAILKHKWVRLNVVLEGIKEDLLTMLVSCRVGGTQVRELTMGIMCNLSHDACCDLEMMERTGALENVLQQAFSSSLVVMRHVAGTLGNLTRTIVSTFVGCTSVEWKGEVTLVDALKRLGYVDDQRISFRTSAILYGLTRNRDYVHILPDLRGLGDVVFKLFRIGVLQTQNYCLQAFCNMAHNKDFAASIASDPVLMEDFIVGCMVHTNSSYMKEMSSEVLYYLVSDPNTRLTALKGQGLWALVQLAAANGSAVSMRYALLAVFNLACDLRANARWLNDTTLALVLDFDDEVLGAPAFTGLLYLASTHDSRLSQMMISARMAMEARAKIEGAKFLKRDREEEEDKKFMARTAAGEADRASDESSYDGDNAGGSRRESFSIPSAVGTNQNARLRPSFVASHLIPTLATAYNLCCKSGKATKLFFREGVPDGVTGLLAEMRAAEDPAYYHPQVEVLCVAVLGAMIEDAALVPKLIERHVTPAITEGLDSRIVAVRLSSLWSLLLLGIPGVHKKRAATTAGSAAAATGGDHSGGIQLRMWMLFCREAVMECKAVSALWELWTGTATTLEPGAREHVRFAISTITRIFFMDKVAASYAVRQRGTELLAMTMDFSDASKARATLSICEDDFEYDESSSPFVKVSSICCAVVTVHLPDMTADSVQSVCEGCLDVFLKVLPTDNDELRELCSLATRCLAGHEELLLDLLTEPRFTKILELLRENATPVGGTHIEAVLKRVVVLSAVPGVPDLSPALLNLTDSVFQRKSSKSTENNDTGPGQDSSSLSREGGSRAVSSASITRGSVSSVRAGVGEVESKGNTDTATGIASIKLIVKSPPGSKQLQSSAGSDRARLSVANIRASRMCRLRATQKARRICTDNVNSANPEDDPGDASGGGGAGADLSTPDKSSSVSTVGTLDSKFNVFRNTTESSGAAVRPSGLSADSVEGLDGHLDDNNNNKDNGEKNSITPGKNRDQEDAPSANGSDDLAFLPGIRPLRAKPKTGVTGSESASASKPIAQSRMTASRVGKHESVAMWRDLAPNSGRDGSASNNHSDGGFETKGGGASIQDRSSMLERLNDADDDGSLSDSTQPSDEDLVIAYNDDEIRQVQRLVFRVVEAELSTTVVESVMEVVAQLREVARSQCTAFQRRSEEFRIDILSTGRGQALPLPHSCSVDDGRGREGRDAAPASPTGSPTRAAERPPGATNWDPARQLLLLMGMPALDMAPGWQFDSTQSFDGNGGGPKKVNLCTTKFVDETKTLVSTEVALPIPLPEELARLAQKGDADLPSGLERCILPPLERPTSQEDVSNLEQPSEATLSTAAAAPSAASERPALETDEFDPPATSESGDAAAPCSSGGTGRPRRGGPEEAKVGGRGCSRRTMRGFKNSNNYNSSSTSRDAHGVEHDSSGRMNFDGNFAAPRTSRYTGDGGSRGKFPPLAVLNAGRGVATTLPGGNGSLSLFSDPIAPSSGHVGATKRPGGGWDESLPPPVLGTSSGLPAFSLGALFSHSPLLTALSLVDHGTSATSYGEGLGRCRGRPNNRSDVPGLATDTNSLRIRRGVEEREAGRERQKLLRSLGVGTRRTLKVVAGKGGRMLLVNTTTPPGRSAPSCGAAAMVV